jgi:hypothetical protein
LPDVEITNMGSHPGIIHKHRPPEAHRMAVGSVSRPIPLAY